MEVEERQLRYPSVKGYRLGEEIGGGGFSKSVIVEASAEAAVEGLS